MIHLLLTVFALSHSSDAAYCGASTIPYSLEVLPDGSTVLGCARPSCFGWDSRTGRPSSFNPSFRDSNGHPDGFFRQGPPQQMPFDATDPRVYSQQTADCAATPGSTCGPNQWIAGIEQNNYNQTQVWCCSIAALSQAEPQGVASVNPGQIVVGGEVYQQDTQSHFDYISSLQKVLRPDGSVGYDVGIGRLPCQDIPTPLPAPFAFQQAVQPPPVVPPVQPYYPTSSSASSGYYCFTADTKVRLLDGSEKRMDQLEKKDWVQTVTNHKSTYVPVSFWLHRIPTQKAEFLKISLSNGNELKMTRSHYIYKTSCKEEGELEFESVSRKAVTAENVAPGDCLYTLPIEGRPSKTRVLSVESVEETGIFSPMTSNGKIVVNGIVASCHSVVQSHAIQNTFFEWVDYLHDKVYQSFFFGSTENERHLPSRMNTMLSLVDYVVPTSFLKF